MKDMKDRVRRTISTVAVREHWRMRRVLLLVMVAVTVLGMVTVSSMADAVQPRRVYVVLTADGRTEIISGRPSRSMSFGILETRACHEEPKWRLCGERNPGNGIKLDKSGYKCYTPTIF